MARKTDYGNSLLRQITLGVAILALGIFVAPISAQQAEKSAVQYYVDGVNFFTRSRMRDAERVKKFTPST